MTESWDERVFDRLYAEKSDPWDFRTSPYERAKYDATLAALPEGCGNALEIGCSIGVLTARLAPRCDYLLALDLAEAALATARATCAGHDNVSFARARIPADWPPGRFDVILLSEVLYFLSPEDVRRAARHAVSALAPGGTILLVNWTGPNDAPCTGDEAASTFIDTCGLVTDLQQRAADYRVDRLHSEEGRPKASPLDTTKASALET